MRCRDWPIIVAYGFLLPPSLHAAPIAVATVIDISSRFGEYELAESRELTVDLLRQLPPKSQLSVLACGSGVENVALRSNNLEEVQSSLSQLAATSNGTALYDCLEQAIRHLDDRSGGSKAIVLISDGSDDRSRTRFDWVIELALQSKIPIFAIGVGPEPSANLKRFATSTGGEYLTLADAGGYILAKRISKARGPLDSPSDTRPLEPAVPEAVNPIAILAVLGFLSVGGFYGWLRLRRAAQETAPPEISLPGSGAEQAPPPGQQAEQRVTTAFLLLQNGAGAGNRYELRRSSFLIGKSPAASLRLGGQAVADEHCRIRFEPPDFFLEDLGSAPGTLVNSQRIRLHPLQDGDIITVAGTSFKFQVELDGPMMG